MLWKFAVVLAISAVSLMGASAFAQSASTYGVTNPQGGQPYNVNYTLAGGTISDMRISTQDTSLVISLNATSDGNLVIDLPRSLIDAKTNTGDDQFIVLVDDTYTSFHETKTSTDRTLTIPFSSDSGRIEIIGTQVVPEFGSLSSVILALSIMTALLVVRTRFRIHP